MADQQPPKPGLAKKATGWTAIAIMVVGAAEGVTTYAYKDPVGIPTICYGETRGVKMGDRATMAECETKLAQRLIEFDQTLQRCAGKELVEGLPAQTRAAYVSFLYNVGPGQAGKKDGFCVLKNGRESSMLRYLKSGEYMRSCQEFPKWATGVGGVKLRGLEIRRDKEMGMCIKGFFPPVSLNQFNSEYGYTTYIQ